MNREFYPCGHPRTPENKKRGRQCRTCYNASQARRRREIYASMTPQERYLEYRVKFLPTQLERARGRVRQLEAEAARYGMTELLGPETTPALTTETPQ